jgi:hypothetical protein
MMDAFNRRDINAFVEPTTADFEWFPALGMAVEGGRFRERAGAETYFETLQETWEEGHAGPIRVGSGICM